MTKRELLAGMAIAYVRLVGPKPLDNDGAALAVTECREIVYDLVTDNDVDWAIAEVNRRLVVEDRT